MGQETHTTLVIPVVRGQETGAQRRQAERLPYNPNRMAGEMLRPQHNEVAFRPTQLTPLKQAIEPLNP